MVLLAYVKKLFLTVKNQYIKYFSVRKFNTFPNVLDNVSHYRLCAVNLIPNSMQRRNCRVYFSDLYYDLISVLVVCLILNV